MNITHPFFSRFCRSPISRRAAVLLAALGILALRLPAQTITMQPTNQVVVSGSNALFSVTVSGTGPFTYQWQFNGTNLPNSIITTVAGNGSYGYSGDGGPATSAELLHPGDVAVDGFGNLFIVDQDNYRIRKVDTNGIITTIAGNGTYGDSGDGGPATNASMGGLGGVAVDRLGNLLIGDMLNSRVRKVDTNGIITTVAGYGQQGYSGNGGPATNATLWYPGAVAVDASGDLFIADGFDGCIRKVGTNGIITTVAGVPEGTSWPYTSGYSGDGGPATSAKLCGPSGVAVDGFGNLFIADYGNYRIRKVDTNGIIATVAGNGTNGYSGDGGPATNASTGSPAGVAVDGFGNLFIADYGNYRIRKVDTNGIIATVAGNGTNGYSGDGGPATNASTGSPAGVAVDGFGNLLIGDRGNNRVRKVTQFGSIPTLRLSNVTTNNAGSYAVIVTGAYGSVTSSIVTLTVVFPPSITSQPQSITVTNCNPASITVAASGTEPLSYQWYFNTNMPVDGGASATLTLANAITNEAGNYFCVITNAYGSITSAVVTLTVLPAGSLQVNITPSGAVDAGAQWRVDGGAWQASGTSICNVGAGDHTVAFSNIAGWTTPTKQPVAVVLNQTTVATGVYVQQFGRLQVTLSPAGAIILGAQWQLDGGAWQDSGATLTNIPVATHTVSFSAVPGWTSPTNRSVAIASNQTAHITGIYQQQGAVQVTIGPAAAVTAGAQWQVDGGAWQNSGVTVSNLAPGSHTISFSTITNWTKPSDQVVAVVSSQTTNVTASYIAYGSLQGNLAPPSAVSAGARWQVDGGVWQTNGAVVPNLLAGEHTVAFTNLFGWITPSNQTVTISLAQTSLVTGVYVQQFGSLEVTLSPSGAIIAGGQWQLDGGAWQNSGTVLTRIPVAAHRVSFSALPGWVAPAAQSVTVFAEQTNATMGVYTGLGYSFSTIAGTAGSSGWADGTNTTALFYTPVGIAVDLQTNLYIADTGNSVIRKLTPTANGWVSSTIAGLASNPGSTDGTNREARFDYPSGVTVDTNGNIYVADQGNSTVRKISLIGTNWVVSTIAGLAGKTGSANGTNSAARFYYPASVAVDLSGNVYVADQNNSVIRKVTLVGTNWAVTTIAGTAGANGITDGTNAASRFYWPSGVAVDTNGNIYVADTFNDTVRKITVAGTNYLVSTLCGQAQVNGSVDGTNTAAQFDGPSGIAVDNSGNVYVADANSSVIRKITPVGTNWVVNTIGGLAYVPGTTDGTNSTARFDGPCGVCASPAGVIFVADTHNDTIRAGTPLYPLPPIPNLTTKSRTANTFEFLWSAQPGLFYQVQFKTNLLQGDWINLLGSTLATDSQMPFLDTAATNSEGFYRVLVLP
jgi:hypothetical protein